MDRQQPYEWGRRLRAARAYADLSQRELAEQLGISATTLKRYEHAELPPADPVRIGLEVAAMRACGVPAEWFTWRPGDGVDGGEPWAVIMARLDDLERAVRGEAGRGDAEGRLRAVAASVRREGQQRAS